MTNSSDSTKNPLQGVGEFIAGHPRAMFLLIVMLVGQGFGGKPAMFAFLAIIAGYWLPTNALSIAIVGALVGSLFGTGGIVVGAGLGYLSGWLGELSRSQPVENLPVRIGRVYGFVLGGFLTVQSGVDMSSFGGVLHWLLVLSLYPMMGGFVVDCTVGMFNFFHSIEGEDDGPLRA